MGVKGRQDKAVEDQGVKGDKEVKGRQDKAVEDQGVKRKKTRG